MSTEAEEACNRRASDFLDGFFPTRPADNGGFRVWGLGFMESQTLKSSDFRFMGFRGCKCYSHYSGPLQLKKPRSFIDSRSCSRSFWSSDSCITKGEKPEKQNIALRTLQNARSQRVGQ